MSARDETRHETRDEPLRARREQRMARAFRAAIGVLLAAPTSVVVACTTGGGTDSETRSTIDAGDASARDALDPCAPIAYDAAAIEGDAATCAQLRYLPCGLP